MKSYKASLTTSLLLAIELPIVLGALALPFVASGEERALPQITQANSLSIYEIAASVNKERVEFDLNELVIDGRLNRAAEAKAEDMAANGYFAHQDLNGDMSWHWINKYQYDYEYAGENLAEGFVDPRSMVKAWMASPSHKKNMLRKDFVHTGIGMAKGMIDGRESVFVVQIFASPASTVGGSKIEEEPREGEVSSQEYEVRAQLEYFASVSKKSYENTFYYLAILALTFVAFDMRKRRV